MTDDTIFINWLVENGFEITSQTGKMVFKYTHLEKDGLGISIGHDAVIHKRIVSYFHLFDGKQVRRRVDKIDETHHKKVVLMWELPFQKEHFQDALDGKLKPML